MRPMKPRPDESSPRIVVVEDNGPTLRIVSDFLAQSGFDVARAGTASEAKDAIAKEACHALLLDLHLPDSNGNAFVREVRNHPDPEVSNIVIALLTASPLSSDRDDCLRAGADLFLTKPIRLRELARLLKGYIRSRFP